MHREATKMIKGHVPLCILEGLHDHCQSVELIPVSGIMTAWFISNLSATDLLCDLY